MNKKQILKEQKRLKEERKQAEKMFQDDKGLKSLIKITICVIVFIGLAFAVINIMNGTWKFFAVKNYNTEIDSQMVMVGTMLNKGETEDEEYLVLAFDMNSDDNDYYKSLTENYYDSKKLYYLDLSSGFNQNNIGDKFVISNDLDKLRLAGPALLTISDGKITKSLITEEEITDYFMNLK